MQDFRNISFPILAIKSCQCECFAPADLPFRRKSGLHPLHFLLQTTTAGWFLQQIKIDSLSKKHYTYFIYLLNFVHFICAAAFSAPNGARKDLFPCKEPSPAPSTPSGCST
jgi:hypothetical protein